MDKISEIDNIFAEHYLQVHFGCNCLMEVGKLLSNTNNDATAAGSDNETANEYDIHTVDYTFDDKFQIAYSTRIDGKKIMKEISQTYMRFIGRMAEIQYNVNSSYFQDPYLKDEYQSKEDDE